MTFVIGPSGIREETRKRHRTAMVYGFVLLSNEKYNYNKME